MEESYFCKGQNCPWKERCDRYQHYSRLPLTTRFWWGIAHGTCQDFIGAQVATRRPDLIFKMIGAMSGR